nr:hypothetical protein [Methylobacterium sp. Leaf122]
MDNVEGFALRRGPEGETCPLHHRRDSPGEFSTVRLIDNNAALRQHGISLVGAPLRHVSPSTDRWICRLVDERGTQVRLKRPARRAARLEMLAETNSPEGLLARLITILVDPPRLEGVDYLVRLAFAALGENRILRAEADLLLTLADAREKVGWHSPPQIIDAGLRMIPGTRRHQRHSYHPGSPKSLFSLIAFFAAQRLGQLMVPRKGLGPQRFCLSKIKYLRQHVMYDVYHVVCPVERRP